MSVSKDFWKNQLYGRKLYQAINDEYDLLPTKPAINERERWHLRQMHGSRRVKYLAKWLAANVSRYFTGVEVRVRSVWIDLTPQAYFDYVDSSTGTTESDNCELSDLLIVLDVSDTVAKADTRRATLLQAKVVKAWDRLDASAAGTSSDVERNLLELSRGDRVVRKGTSSASGTLVNSPYDLGAPGLADYARYLLIPSELKSVTDEPYRVLWPRTRSDVSGTINSMGDLLLGMTGLFSRSGHVAGKPVHPVTTPTLDAWSALVHDLLDLYSGRKKYVKKFEEHTEEKFPRVVDSGTYTARSGWENVVHQTKKFAIWLAYEVAMAAEAFSPKVSIVPGIKGYSGFGGKGDEQALDGGGFMLLHITVSVAEARQAEYQRHG